MKNLIILFFIGILYFGNNNIFALEEGEYYDTRNLTEEQQLLEGQKVVAEIEKENKNEKGIYFFDSIKKKIINFFNYNDEFNSTSTPKITEDGNSAIYSIGNSVFLKKSNNYLFGNNKNLGVGDFGEINVDENSVKLFKTERKGGTLVLSWKDEEKFDGYIIQIKDDVDGFLNGNSKSLVYLLKKDIKNGEKIFSNIKKKFLNGEKIFLTEKKFSGSELKIFLDENFFYAKIFGIKDGKISTSSAQKILYGNKKNLKPNKNFSKIEKLNFPILMENYLKVSDLFYLEKEDGDIFSWDFDGDYIFEKSGENIFLESQQNTKSFFVNLKITKKNGEQFIRKIQLDFFSPKIFFDEEIGGKIFGHIEPKIKNFPVFYIYENNGVKKISDEKIFTYEDGKFNFFKKSEHNQEINGRKIYGSNKEYYGRIYSNTGNVELKFGEKKGNFLVIYNQGKVVAVIYSKDYLGKNFEIYDKKYILILNKNTNKKTDFFIKKDGKNLFYLNF